MGYILSHFRLRLKAPPDAAATHLYILGMPNKDHCKKQKTPYLSMNTELANEWYFYINTAYFCNETNCLGIMIKQIIIILAVIIVISIVLAVGSYACYGDKFVRPPASEVERKASFAISQDVPSSLKNSLSGRTEKFSGQSGFKLLTKGTDSLKYRLALIMAADKTIDLQYYSMNDDISGQLLMGALLAAAEKGVRVRLLLDHITIDEIEHSLVIFDGWKNIEVRIFNPPTIKQQSILSRYITKMRDFMRGLKRMHNKAMVVDNQMAIMGGRNLGNEYFEIDQTYNFEDLDMLVAGPVTDDISHSFDHYWNGDNAFPISALPN